MCEYGRCNDTETSPTSRSTATYNSGVCIYAEDRAARCAIFNLSRALFICCWDGLACAAHAPPPANSPPPSRASHRHGRLRHQHSRHRPHDGILAVNHPRRPQSRQRPRRCSHLINRRPDVHPRRLYYSQIAGSACSRRAIGSRSPRTRLQTTTLAGGRFSRPSSSASTTDQIDAIGMLSTCHHPRGHRRLNHPRRPLLQPNAPRSGMLSSAAITLALSVGDLYYTLAGTAASTILVGLYYSANRRDREALGPRAITLAGTALYYSQIVRDAGFSAGAHRPRGHRRQHRRMNGGAAVCDNAKRARQHGQHDRRDRQELRLLHTPYWRRVGQARAWRQLGVARPRANLAAYMPTTAGSSSLSRTLPPARRIGSYLSSIAGPGGIRRVDSTKTIAKCS